MEESFVRGDPYISGNTGVYNDFDWGGRRSKGALGRERLSSVCGQVELGSRSAIEYGVVLLIRGDGRVTGQRRY